MSVLLRVIPLPTDRPLFELKVALSGTDYLLAFDFNGRQDRWYCGLYTVAREPIRVGMKVVCAWDVLRCCSHPARPLGRMLFLADTALTISAPRFSDLGRSVTLAYIETVDDGNDVVITPGAG